MHEPVFAAVKGGKGHGANQFPIVKFGGTHRAGLGFTGETRPPGLAAPALPGRPFQSGNSHPEKKGVTKPEKDYAYYHKNQNFNNILHFSALAARRSPYIIAN